MKIEDPKRDEHYNSLTDEQKAKMDEAGEAYEKTGIIDMVTSLYDKCSAEGFMLLLVVKAPFDYGDGRFGAVGSESLCFGKHGLTEDIAAAANLLDIG